jgi:tetratricopeptide (TPR) repeat protein
MRNIDADERLLPCARRELEKLLAAPCYLGHYVKLRMKRGFTAYWEMRLFRNDPEIRFRNVIHENIWPALKRRMRATGERVGYSELILEHDGYEGDQSRKHERNLPLLLRALEVEPERVYCWYHVGRIHREQARFAEALAALERGIELVRAKRVSEGQDSLVFAERLRLGLEQDEPGLAALAREARRLFPTQAYLLWLEGQLLLRERDIDEAAQRFLLLLRGPPDDALNESLGYDQRLFSAWPLAGLATCRFQQGRYAEAHELFAQAAAADPTELERDLCESLARRSQTRS